VLLFSTVRRPRRRVASALRVMTNGNPPVGRMRSPGVVGSLQSK
jgi:hypothetical protein